MVDEEYGKLSSPAKDEVLVVVERSEPTVSWVPVAMRAVPRELETMIELGEKEEEFVPPLATGSIPDTCVVRETVPPKLPSVKHEPDSE